jgi:hypothetical protein
MVEGGSHPLQKKEKGMHTTLVEQRTEVSNI